MTASRPMAKSGLTLALAVLCSAALCWAADRSPPVRDAGNGLSICVLPDRVYPEVVYKLRLDGAAEAADVYWSWTASTGEILSDGEREVFWKSPG